MQAVVQRAKKSLMSQAKRFLNVAAIDSGLDRKVHVYPATSEERSARHNARFKFNMLKLPSSSKVWFRIMIPDDDKQPVFLQEDDVKKAHQNGVSGKSMRIYIKWAELNRDWAKRFWYQSPPMTADEAELAVKQIGAVKEKQKEKNDDEEKNTKTADEKVTTPKKPQNGYHVGRRSKRSEKARTKALTGAE